MLAKPWMVILPVILLLSPLVLIVASKQDKPAKLKLRLSFGAVLVFQLILALFNWETMKGPGRSGLELAFIYPGSFLNIFFLIAIAQLVLVTLNKSKTDIIAVVLNFVNSFLIFASLIVISKTLGKQIASPASIFEVFVVLTGNIIGLTLINKDKYLLLKYPWNQKK